MDKKSVERRQRGYNEVSIELAEKRKEYIEVYSSDIDIHDKYDKLEEINKELEVLKKEAVALYNEAQLKKQA